jgi:hypothetical protein
VTWTVTNHGQTDAEALVEGFTPATAAVVPGDFVELPAGALRTFTETIGPGHGTANLTVWLDFHIAQDNHAQLTSKDAAFGCDSSPTPSTGTTPPGRPTTGTAPGLPVTGTSVAALIGIAVVLFAAGIALVVLARGRKARRDA